MKRRSYRYGKLKLGILLLALPFSTWFCGGYKTTVLWWNCRQNEKQLHELRKGVDTTGLFLSGNISCSSGLSDGKLLDGLRQIKGSEAVTILKYTPWLISEDKEVQHYTAKLILTGGFMPMLKLLATLEREGRFGSIAAAVFRMQANTYTHRKQLELTLWIEQITEKLK